MTVNKRRYADDTDLLVRLPEYKQMLIKRKMVTESEESLNRSKT